jgi:transposase
MSIIRCSTPVSSHRGKFALAIQQLEPTIIAMEAYSAAHYWRRRLMAIGHEVRLVPPQHAKAFRRVHKSDAYDTISIAEAALRPNLHFVPVKTIAHQDLPVIHHMFAAFGSDRPHYIESSRG